MACNCIKYILFNEVDAIDDFWAITEAIQPALYYFLFGNVMGVSEFFQSSEITGKHCI
jgi:hypothetical protein